MIKLRALYIALCLIALAGCSNLLERQPTAAAGADIVDQVQALISTAKARDARYLTVRDRPYLMFDQASATHLANYGALAGISDKRALLTKAIENAHTLGDSATRLELERVPPARLAGLAAGGDGASDPASVMQRYGAASAARAAQDVAAIGALPDEAALDRYQQGLTAAIDASIKTRGRSLRQLALLPLRPFVQLWMGLHILASADERVSGNFDDATRFLPPDYTDAERDPRRMSDDALLRYYAPAIEIERRAQVSYDPKDDRFGKVWMSGSDTASAQPRIDVEQPTVYTYVEQHAIDGMARKQLVYNFWFPERPQLDGAFDPETGSTQGAIIRVTLNSDNRPLVYENVSSCGCYYKVFPMAELEQRARLEYGTPLAHKTFVLENDVPHKIDVNIPNLVAAAAEPRVIAAYTAGAHDVASVEPFTASPADGSAAHYALSPYEDLESLPFQDGRISMFDQDGLVRNADRLESTLLAASGMYHAGTPRQRGTLMIYFDQADFDDPGLLAHYLRLPRRAFEATPPQLAAGH